jgi:hypothetical protein
MAVDAISEAATADQRPRLLTNAPLPTNSTLVSRATGVANFVISGAPKFCGARIRAGRQTISVYISDGHTLLMNTGNAPFALGPVYISYNHSDDGATTFDT